MLSAKIIIVLQTHGVLLQYLELLTSPSVISLEDYATKVLPSLAELHQDYGIYAPICMHIIQPVLHLLLLVHSSLFNILAVIIDSILGISLVSARTRTMHCHRSRGKVSQGCSHCQARTKCINIASPSPMSCPGTRNPSNDSRTSGGKETTDADRGSEDHCPE